MELKPCPFCGAQLERCPPLDDGTPVARHPGEKGCALVGLYFDDKHWNTRTTTADDALWDDALTLRIAREAVIDIYKADREMLPENAPKVIAGDFDGHWDVRCAKRAAEIALSASRLRSPSPLMVEEKGAIAPR